MNRKWVMLSVLVLTATTAASACGGDDDNGGGGGGSAGSAGSGGTAGSGGSGGSTTGGSPSTGGTTNTGGSTMGTGGMMFSFDAGPPEPFATDPACPDVTIQGFMLPGCCDPVGVCGAYATPFSQCFTPEDATQFGIDAGPPVSCTFSPDGGAGSPDSGTPSTDSGTQDASNP